MKTEIVNAPELGKPLKEAMKGFEKELKALQTKLEKRIEYEENEIGIVRDTTLDRADFIARFGDLLSKYSHLYK
jgi:hypothetical protein